jgi:hypothetical protein
MAQQGAACRSSAPGITLVLPRANRSSFGPAYPVSKLLKFFKLFGQRPNTEPESKGTIVSLDTQHPPRTEKTDIYLSTTTSNFGSKKSASTLQTWQNRSLLWSQKDGSNDGTTLIPIHHNDLPSRHELLMKPWIEAKAIGAFPSRPSVVRLMIGGGKQVFFHPAYDGSRLDSKMVAKALDDFGVALGINPTQHQPPRLETDHPAHMFSVAFLSMPSPYQPFRYGLSRLATVCSESRVAHRNSKSAACRGSGRR